MICKKLKKIATKRRPVTFFYKTKKATKNLNNNVPNINRSRCPAQRFCVPVIRLNSST